jgi:hypothetical protein
LKLSHLVFALALAGAATAGHAGSLGFDGTLNGMPVFDRPVERGDRAPVALADFGIDMPYSALAFSVSVAGSYSFLSTPVEGWDNYSFLYAGSFNPASPLANVLVGNDDAPGGSGFSRVLDAGKTYVFVTTVFDGDPDQSFWGSFHNSISGPGSVTAVPEPQSYALMGLGLAALAFARRRRG